MVVTVDGYAGSGKSTIAKALAKKLNFSHIDVGMLFRAISLYILETKKSFNEVPHDLDLQFKDGLIFLNGKDVSVEARGGSVLEKVSEIGGDDNFRNLVYNIEREQAKKGSIVVSGRDTGTAVFPNADYKFFVKASIDVRAKRRALDFESRGDKIDLEKIKTSIANRDRDDEKYGNLVIPKDGVILDNSEGSVEEKVLEILSYIKTN